jgi:hypothetical protein
LTTTSAGSAGTSGRRATTTSYGAESRQPDPRQSTTGGSHRRAFGRARTPINLKPEPSIWAGPTISAASTRRSLPGNRSPGRSGNRHAEMRLHQRSAR